MDTLRTLGGWLLAAFCVPTVGVLVYQRGQQPAAAPTAQTADHTGTPADPVGTSHVAHEGTLPGRWFDSVPFESDDTCHLRGVKCVLLAPAAEKNTLFTQDDVRAKAEFKLRQAGVKVVTKDEQAGMASAIVVVEASIGEVEDLSILYSYRVQTRVYRHAVTRAPESGRLSRGLACVWQKCESGHAGSLVVRTGIYSKIENQVEQLANAWADANQR